MAEATPDHADVAVVSETPLSVNKLAAFHANPSVFKSIRYPSSDAVRITQDALRAASQYYELFFQTPTEGPAPSQDGTAVAAPSPAPTKARERGAVRKTSKAEASAAIPKTRKTTLPPRGGTITAPPPTTTAGTATEHTVGTPASSSPAANSNGTSRRTVLGSSTSRGHRVSLCRPPVSDTASGSAHSLTDAKGPSDPKCGHPTLQAMSLVTDGGWRQRVCHSPYHTFFPPYLSSTQRRHIIRQILGHRARPYREWAWRKSAEYLVLHQLATHQNTNYEGNSGAHATAGHLSDGQPSRTQQQQRGAAYALPPSGGPHWSSDASDITANPIYHSFLQPHSAASPTSTAGASHHSANLILPPRDGVPNIDELSGVRDDLVIDERSCTYTIPASQQGPEYFSQTAEDGSKTLIIVMVGLPARGKTFLAQKICRLLGWHGTRAKVQNLQVAWRRLLLDCDAEEATRSQPALRKGASSSTSSNPTVATTTAGDQTTALPTGTPPPATGVSATPGAASGKAHRVTVALPPVAEVVRSPTLTSPCTSMLPHTIIPHGANPTSAVATVHVNPTTALHAATRTDGTQSAVQSGNRDDPGVATPVGRPRCLTAAHFRALITEPRSVARRLYRHVLRSFAEDCRMFFRDGGQVVVVNDDFITEELREEAEHLFRPLASQLFFMEVMRDAHLNSRFNECKVKDPTEYPTDGTMHDEFAKKDFDERLEILERLYEPLGNPTAADASHDDAVGVATGASHDQSIRPSRSFIKINNSDKIETHGISGYLASRVISYVMNLSQVKIQHPIYFVRHGESCYNLEDRIGGNPFLTPQGMRDAAALLEFIESLQQHLRHMDREENQRHLAQQQRQQESSDAVTTTASSSRSSSMCCQCDSAVAQKGKPDAAAASEDPSRTLSTHAGRLEIWTSQLRRTIQTAELSERLLSIKTLRWSSLNEIHAGVCEDMTYAEVRRTYPLIETFRKDSKYTFRYPNGESYQDLVVRLEPVIMELENADKVVIVVAHQAVLRCLLAYFGSTSAESSICVSVPHRTVWRCTYDSKGIASLDELYLDNVSAGFQSAPLDGGEGAA